jgi:beta-lactam-binding protein with PASTA domain
MSIKSFFQESVVGFILKRILLAAVIVVILSWITLLLIDVYTRHGESVPVPDVRGLYFDEANNILNNSDLYALIIDSVYVRDKALGTILEQIPAAGSSVKKQRNIFLIVNKNQFKKIPLPDVGDISQRQADALLRSVGLKVSNVIYSPSEFKDLVIDVLYNGRSITPGSRITEGASVVLVVGSGMGENVTRVPSLTGLTLVEAREIVIQSSFVLGAVNYDEAPSNNENKYFIYRQRPSGNQAASAGSRIDIWMTKDQNLLQEYIESEDEEAEETFF